MTWRRIAPWVILTILALAIVIDLPFNLLGDGVRTRLGLDLQGGQRVTLEVVPPSGQTVTDQQVETARDIIERRVGGIGVSEPQVRTQTSSDGTRQIVVEVPGATDENQVRSLVGSTGQLQFLDPKGQTLTVGQDIRPLIENGSIGELFNGGQIDPTSVAPTSDKGQLAVVF